MLSGNATPPKILLVEDEGLIAHQIAAQLSKAGYQVAAIADNSRAAQEAAAAHLPDLILMDIRIKGEADGIETAAAIREKHDIPIIFLTAHTDRGTIDRAKTTAPYGYLTKPLGAAALQTAIEIAIQQHRRQLQRQESESRLTSALNATRDAVVSTNPLGLVQFVNQQAELLTGWPWDRAHGRSIHDVLSFSDPHLSAVLADRVARAISTKTALPFPEHAIVYGANNSRAAVTGTITPCESSGRVLGVSINLRKVT